MFKKLLVALVMGFILVGCDNGPKMDSSTPEALKNSFKAMSENLQPQEQEKLKKAIFTAMFTVAKETGGKEPEASQALSKKIDGKTAKEIIEEFGNNK